MKKAQIVNGFAPFSQADFANSLCLLEYAAYMTTPIISQTPKYSHVRPGKLSIRNTQQPIEIIGKTGTNGTRNPLSSCLCVFLKMSTDKLTIANVNNAPILARLDRSFKSINPEITAVIPPITHILATGVSLLFVLKTL